MSKHWLSTLLLLSTACSASPDLRVGREPEGPVAGPAGGASGAGGKGAIGSGENALLARVTEPPGEMAIEVVTISCAGECRQVLAIASGGNDPYTFAWNDGVTTAAREICVADDTTFTVTVNDTLIGGEFPYAGQTVTASVTAVVLVCPSDGGTVGSDAAIPGSFCVLNPSLEGVPGTGEMGLQLPEWQICAVTPDIAPLSPSEPSPSDGATYVRLGAVFGLVETLGGTLCAPLTPNVPTSFQVDLALRDVMPGSHVALEIWGGRSEPCARDELLWRSPEITEPNLFQTFCATITPTQSISRLLLTPTSTSTAALLVDNFRQASLCE